jgi:hypothetical protein
VNPVKGLSREGNRREGEDQQQSRAALHVQHSTGSLQPLQHITGMLRLPLTSSSPVTCSLSFYSGARASTYLRIVPTCTLHLAPCTPHITSHISHLTPHTSYLIPHTSLPAGTCPVVPWPALPVPHRYCHPPRLAIEVLGTVQHRTAAHRSAPHRTASHRIAPLRHCSPSSPRKCHTKVVCTLTPWLFSFLQWVCTSILRCPKQP